jgi:hypothetical protein
MDSEANHLHEEKDPNFMNRRAQSHRYVKRDTAKNLASQQTAGQLHGTKSFRLKPENILNKARPGSRLVPSFQGQRKQSVQLKQSFSDRRLPGNFITHIQILLIDIF